MGAKLIAYSVIEVAPPGYQTPYGVGIIEAENGQRGMVRIKPEYLAKLKSGMEGDLRKENVDSQELYFFYPK